MRYIIALLCIAICTHSYCQNSTEKDSVLSVLSIPDKSLEYIERKYSSIAETIDKQNVKVLKVLQEKEDKLKKKLQSIDSSKAKELFDNSKAKYQELESKIKGSVSQASSKLKEYITGLDSISTSLKFLSQPSLNTAINTDKLGSLTGTVSDLQSKLQLSNELQDFIREREAQLKEALLNTGLVKDLLAINKEVYYYQAKLKEYKELLNDKKKLEKELLTVVTSTSLFKKFMEKHSYLATLFPQPDNYDPTIALNGLQTRAGIQQAIAQQLGLNSSGINPEQLIQQQIQSAQSEMDKLKDKVKQLGSGNGNSDMTMPDFKPDNQKTKKFLQRLEYGLNIQNSKSNYFLPSMSDIAATLGYKLNDNASMGIGLSYKIGWGNSLRNISISHQGIGLRSYFDVKAKGSLWLSGGVEYNYMQEFKKIEEIKNLDIWQRSALTGLTKKIKLGKKRESKVQLLYDFLANKQVPQSSPLKFRIGWSF